MLRSSTTASRFRASSLNILIDLQSLAAEKRRTERHGKEGIQEKKQQPYNTLSQFNLNIMHE